MAGLIGEVGLRVLGYSGMNPKPWAFFVHDPILGWTNAPGVEAEFSGPRPWPIEYRTRVSINSLGLRGPEPTTEDPAALRVLAIGDSVTAAFEVPYPETFGARIEDKLSEQLGISTRVFNGGVRGYGLDQTYLWYRDRLRGLDPHAVLLMVSWNDIEDNVAVHNRGRPYAKGAFALDADEQLRRVGVPVPDYPYCSLYRLNDRFEIQEVSRPAGWLLCSAREALFDHSAFLTFVSMMVQELPSLVARATTRGGKGAEPEEPDQASYKLVLARRLLQAIAEVAMRDGTPLVIAGHSEQLGPLALNPLGAMGVTLVEIDEVYAGDPRSFRFQHDPHWNANGHERAAEILAPVLAESLWTHRLSPQNQPEQDR
jgi:hypothetical protein